MRFLLPGQVLHQSGASLPIESCDFFFLLRSARQHSTPVAGDSCLPVSLYPSMSVFICTLWISAE